MGEKRKLQAEIDRVLKRVQEGVDVFEEIWDKIHLSTNSNQKEKFESDLKKEIKKLQRHRDQIKTWLSSSDVKDKTQLMDARKLIESKMERFKVVERETKTKAYSKEGLQGAQKLDPAQQEMDEVTDWLRGEIDLLNQQIDQFDAEVESIYAVKKKKMEKEKQERLDELSLKSDRHKFHIKKLETILRLLDNDQLSIDKVKEIKDDIDYYVESNQDPDFEENELIYEDLDLDELASGAGYVAPSPTDAEDVLSLDQLESPTSASPSPQQSQKDRGDDSSSSRSRKASSEERVVTQQRSSRTTPIKHTPSAPTIVPQPLGGIHPPGAGLPAFQLPASFVAASTPHSSIPPPPLPLPPAAQGSFKQPRRSHGRTRSNNKDIKPVNSISNPALSLTSVSSDLGGLHTIDFPAPPQPTSAPSYQPPPPLQLQTAIEQQQQQQQPQLNGPSSLMMPSGGFSPQVSGTSPHVIPSLQALAASRHHQTMPQMPTIGGDRTIPTLGADRSASQTEALVLDTPARGMAPLGPIPLKDDKMYQSRMMESISTHLPHPSDAEKLRLMMPRIPMPTASYYPQVPPAHADTFEFFQRQQPETLFFIFYHMEGTKAQYLAAKALKKLSWRFHTKYMMWFQRHEEPKNITEDYETGTYIYWDYERWAQRRKEGFTFEYRYLEDRELV